MSATLMGAVLSCGPKKGSLRYVLVAIADNADDYGFACPSIQTIAEKACCDERTAMRLVQTLESEGWMRVVRRVLFGKGSVYFIDIAKLGVVVNPKMRKSPLHVEVAKALEKKSAAEPKPAPPPAADPAPPAPPASGDNLSPESDAPPVADFSAPEESGDNPQGSQVTKDADSGDKKPFPILKNRCEPLLNPDNSPLPPSRGVEEPELVCTTELRQAFHAMMREVRDALVGTQENLGPKRPAHLADGYAEWKRCFDDLVPLGWDDRRGADPVLVVEATEPGAAREGLEKYGGRLAKAMHRHFGGSFVVEVQAR
jgi:hypothetical protein